MHIILLSLVITLFAGSLLSLSSHPHWFVRGWDFPRVQIVVTALGAWLVQLMVHWWITPATPVISWSMGILVTSLVVWQVCRIFPYTPIASNQSKAFDQVGRKSSTVDDRHLRLLVSNVQRENESFDLWRKTVQSADPDLIIALETDERWISEMEPLSEQYPHSVRCPQDNYYGISLWSRLKIRHHEVRFLVEDDIPSIDARLELPSGDQIRVVGIHPRPPEPIRNNGATARDAELILWAQELDDEAGPVLIGGDLNDVAWSQTTRLFLRLSGLLDPRRGRGLFSTFHARHWWFRFPLDHIFHSVHFLVRGIELLPHVGSDHFPILIDLQLAPAEQNEHEVLDEKEGDQQEADVRIQRADEDENCNGNQIVSSSRP